MNRTTFAIIAAVLAPMAVQAEPDAAQWVGAELVYDAGRNEYRVQLTLGDDPFMEQLVFDNDTGEYMTKAQAMAKADWEYRNILQWSDEYGEFVSRFALDPCPKQIAGS